MLDLYLDADACPVKEEAYRVARRYDLRVFVVSQGQLRVPAEGRIEAVRAGRGFGAADDWIAGRIGPDDIAVTADIPLADRCLKKGARVIAPNGRTFTDASIGDALAARDLQETLRQMGALGGGPPPFDRRDRSRFLSRLDETIQAIRRG
jgi:uncharacterized protein